MATCDRLRRATMACVCALVGAATTLGSNRADAYELKHGTRGQPLHWGASTVSYVIDKSIEKAAGGGIQAATSAVGGWSGVGGAPPLSTTAGSGAKVGLDGQNSVLFAEKGFEPAGEALAVTVTSYDQTSGEIVDTDIVVNGIHPFAVLHADARPNREESPVSTDGSSSEDGSDSNESPFDLVHVLSHEVGHALGLGDERDDTTALMYAFTSRNDASVRLPSPDDLDGVDALYGASRGATSTASHSGCGQASVVGARAKPADAWAILAVLGGAGAWLAVRRRGMWTPRIDLPLAAALIGIVTGPAPSQPGRPLNAQELRADATARVVSVSTSNTSGLFETTLELEPAVCREQPCPARASARAWGGTLGGITQQVGGEPVPAIGDFVHVVFTATPSSNVSAEENGNVRPAKLLPARR